MRCIHAAQVVLLHCVVNEQCRALDRDVEPIDGECTSVTAYVVDPVMPVDRRNPASCSDAKRIDSYLVAATKTRMYVEAVLAGAAPRRGQTPETGRWCLRLGSWVLDWPAVALPRRDDAGAIFALGSGRGGLS